MRAIWFVLGVAGCGSVKDSKFQDAAVGDGKQIDAPIDAPVGPPPRLHWTFDGNTNNTGTINGFALATPAGVSFVAGKVGMAASFGPGQFSNVPGMKNVLGTVAPVTIG